MKGRTVILPFLGIILIGGAVWAALWWQRQPVKPGIIVEPNMFTEYADEELGFSLSYLKRWTVTSTIEGGGDGSITNVVFSDPQTGDGVTLVVAPVTLRPLFEQSVRDINSDTLTVNGQEIPRWIGKRPSGETVALLFFERNGTLYLLNGPPDHVELVGGSFRFTQP